MGKPSAPTSTSKCSYFSGPGVNRRPKSDFSGSRLSLKKRRSARQRRHSPFGPTCVSGRPQIAHVPTVGSRSIPLSVDDVFNSNLGSRSILWFQAFEEGYFTKLSKSVGPRVKGMYQWIQTHFVIRLNPRDPRLFAFSGRRQARRSSQSTL